MIDTDIQLSFVVPTYNQAGSIGAFLRGLVAEAEGLGESYEIVVVNDGSSDETMAAVRLLDDEHGCFRILELSRSFGVDVAVTAGVEAATGATVITFDRRCENWAALVGQLLGARRDGAEVAQAVSGQKCWNMLAGADRLLGIPSGADYADMRLVTRGVIDSLRQAGRFMPLSGALASAGFRQVTVKHAGQVSPWCPPAPEVKASWQIVALLGLAIGVSLGAAVLFVVSLIVMFAGNGSLLLWGVVFFAAMAGAQLFLVALLSRQIGYRRRRLAGETLYIVRDTTRLRRDDDSSDDASRLTGTGYAVYT